MHFGVVVGDILGGGGVHTSGGGSVDVVCRAGLRAFGGGCGRGWGEGSFGGGVVGVVGVVRARALSNSVGGGVVVEGHGVRGLSVLVWCGGGWHRHSFGGWWCGDWGTFGGWWCGDWGTFGGWWCGDWGTFGGVWGRGKGGAEHSWWW